MLKVSARAQYIKHLFSTHLYLTIYITFVRYTQIIKKGEIIPKTKKFGCVGRGHLTFLFFLKVVK